MSFIPFVKPLIDKRDIRHLSDAAKSGWISKGRYVTGFENKLRKFFKINYAGTTSSGSSAILLAYLILGLKPGDEIVVPGYGFLAAANVARTLGLKVVFADVDISSYCVNIENLKKVITKKTKLVIVIHLYGNMCEIDKIASFCKKKKIFLLEDSAQSLGSKFKGKNSGTFGDMGVFSFAASKTITTGEGGALILKNKNFYQKLLLYRSYGYVKGRYKCEVHGHNLRMSNLLASIGYSQMKRLKEISKIRNKLFSVYKKKLKKKYYSMQIFNENVSPLPWAVPIKLHKRFSEKDRDFIIKKLKENKIEATNGYYSPDELKIFGKTKLPNSTHLSKRIISLPFYEELTIKQVNIVCKKLDEIKL